MTAARKLRPCANCGLPFTGVSWRRFCDRADCERQRDAKRKDAARAMRSCRGGKCKHCGRATTLRKGSRVFWRETCDDPLCRLDVRADQYDRRVWRRRKGAA